MNARQAVLATLKHQPIEFIPGCSFFSTHQSQLQLIGDLGNDPIDYEIKLAKATQSCMVPVYGNMRARVVEKNENSQICQMDNGTRRLVVFKPEWYYETLSRPMDGHKDLSRLGLPDVNSYPDYWENNTKYVKAFIKNGLFTYGTIDGFYAGIWEHCRQIDEFLMDLAEGSSFAEELVNMWGSFMYACAGKLLECGVDCVKWTDDLGSNTGPLMSPECYRKYFFPWHKHTAQLIHQHGKIAMMHSHGNINMLLPNIVETGIDVLDPVGPSDGMDLKALKEKYGKHLSFSGGISRFIADMSLDELKAHLEEVYRVGSKGGGFIPVEEGGVPKDMPKDMFEKYLQIRKEMSIKYAPGL